jgi:competence protein ComEC
MWQPGDLAVHFLNVGHGDCTVIKHPSGRITVIDTSNAEELDEETVSAKAGRDGPKRARYELMRSLGFSQRKALASAGVKLELTNPVQFLTDTYPRQQIFRYIQTHPEMDHMRGLKPLLETHGVTAFWDTDNHRSFTPRDSDKADWKAYQSYRADKGIRRFYTRGDVYHYFAKDDNPSFPAGDRIAILSPSSQLTSDCDDNGDAGDWNNMSFVVKVCHQRYSFIFGGDAGEPAWADILASVSSQLPCTILKASHHGRLSGYHGAAVKAMAPSIVVMSIADECEHEAREEYKKHTKHVFSTYDCGNITMTVSATGEFRIHTQTKAMAA